MSPPIAVTLIADDETYANFHVQSTEADSSPSLTVGRNDQSRIQASRCAREQVRIDVHDEHVSIEQLGANSSFLNQRALTRHTKQPLHDGDTLHLLEGELKYTVRIEGVTAKDGQQSVLASARTTLKRQNTDEKTMSPKKQKVLVENVEVQGDESPEENRSLWIEQQLNALKTRANLDVGEVTSKLPHTTGVETVTKAPDATPADVWEKPCDGLEVFTSKGVMSSEKIAAFDMDGTLILTKSGKVHPVDENDWRIGFDTCFKKLKQLHADNYKLVIFTNQRGLMKASSTDPFRKKIQYIQQKLNVPLQVFVAIHPGRYRKPCTGSWMLLESKYNNGVPIDKSQSFYVGDAAGRPDKWRNKAKKDHSCADRLFAINLDLRFYTPEEYFLGLGKAPYAMPKFEPKSLRAISSLLEPNNASLTSDKTEVIVMCGLPASGKSWFAKKHIVPHKYEYVNRDEVGTWQKCVKMVEVALGKQQSVVVDNTNLDKESRQRYIDVAKASQVPCRCFVMNVSIDHAKHNNLFRQMMGVDAAHKDVNDIVLMGANKRYVEPNVAEGFTEIIRVNIQPSFDDADMERLYYQHMLDK